jgi:hypothetical protein
MKTLISNSGNPSAGKKHPLHLQTPPGAFKTVMRALVMIFVTPVNLNTS